MTPGDVHLAWKAGREIALVDLREEQVFALAHPLFAACIPLSRLEIGIFDMIPRRDTKIVLYDDDGSLVAVGRDRLVSWGYADVGLLEGGLNGWRSAGLELFADVNSPSKAFGELVEHNRKTPHVAASELKAMIERHADMVIMDARPFEEYQTMSIPGSVNVPGAELVLRGPALAPNPETAIVVNCAGRTRSIIGAQSLINAGVPNPVVALRNGTIGWTLDGQALETGQERQYCDVTDAAAPNALRRARDVGDKAGVRRIYIGDLAALEEAGRTLYRFDVRSEGEYLAGHPRGFLPKPGGQLVQETDMAAPVRGARILLYDDHGVRAEMTASWLAQMGWQSFVLEGVGGDDLEAGPRAAAGPKPPACDEITVSELVEASDGSITLLDLASSKQHSKGHVPGARFIMRGRLERDLPNSAIATPIIVISPDDQLARHAIPQLIGLGCPKARVLKGGMRAWQAAGQPIETGMTDALSPADDVYRRPYEGLGNPNEKMQAYLDWEYGLVAQLKRDGSHGFYVI